MKRILAIIVGFLVLFAGAVTFGVWRESQEPVSVTPGPLPTARAQLHAQLEDAKKVETQAEKQDWNSPAALRRLIQGHEQRIEKLKDNTEAEEIVAYDRDTIERLQKRVTELAEQQAAKEAAKEAELEFKKSHPESEQSHPESQQ